MSPVPGVSELWTRARAALLAPAAAAAAVSDIGSGFRIPFSDLGQQVLHLQALIESWLEDDSNARGSRAMPRADAMPLCQRDVASPPELPGYLNLREFSDMASWGTNKGSGGTSQASFTAAELTEAPAPPLVAVFCHASVDYIRMVLAVLAAGAAFLPLDPGWPALRVAVVVRLARPVLLLTSPANKHLLPRELPHSSCRVYVVAPPEAPKALLVPLQQQQQPRRQPEQEGQDQRELSTLNSSGYCEAAPAAVRGAGDGCPGALRRDCTVQRPTIPYFAVLYTSGSTGEPLGVCMRESAWLARIDWMQRRYPLRPPGALQSTLPLLPLSSALPIQQAPTLEDMNIQRPSASGSKICAGVSKLWPEESSSGGRNSGGTRDTTDGNSDSGNGGGKNGERGSVVCFSTAVSFVDHLWQLLAPILAPSGCGGQDGGGDGDQRQESIREASDRQLQAVLIEASVPVVGDPAKKCIAAPTAAAMAGPVGPCNVLIPPPGAMLHPEVFVGLLADHGVSHLVSVPSLLRHLLPALHAGRHRLGSLRLLVSSGEPLAVELATELTKALPEGAQLLNLYGCTELSADCTWFEVGRGGGEYVPSHLGVQAEGDRQRHQQEAGAVSSSDRSVADVGEYVGASATWVPTGWPIGDTQILVLPVLGDAEDGTSPTHGRLGGNGAGNDAGDGLSVTGQYDNDFLRTAHNNADGPVPVVPLPLGSTGEVWVAGSCLSLGYYNPPSASAVAIPEPVPLPAPAPSLLGNQTATSIVPRNSFTSISLGGGLGASTHELEEPKESGGDGDGDGDGGANRENILATTGGAPLKQAVGDGERAGMQEAAARFQKLRLTAKLTTLVATAAGRTPLLEAIYFRTGDLGRLTPSGCLQLLGRVDRQIKVAGVRLDLAEVEVLLAAHPLLREAAVVPAPSAASCGACSHLGWRQHQEPASAPAPKVDAETSTATDKTEGANQERERQPGRLPTLVTENPELLAYVVMALPQEGLVTAASAAEATSVSGSTSTSSTCIASLPQPVTTVLRSWLSERLALRGALRLRFVSLPQLPRNPAGKVMRRQLPLPPPWVTARLEQLKPPPRPQYQDRQLDRALKHHDQSRTVSIGPPSEVAVMRAIVAATGLTDLEATTDFFAAGMSSLEAMQVAALLETDVRLLLSYSTPRALAAAMRATVRSGDGAGDGSRAGGDSDSLGPPMKRPRREGIRPLSAPLVTSAARLPAAGLFTKKRVMISAGGSPIAAAAAAGNADLQLHRTDTIVHTATSAANAATVSPVIATDHVGDGEGRSSFRELVRACSRLTWQCGGGGGTWESVGKGDTSDRCGICSSYDDAFPPIGSYDEVGRIDGIGDKEEEEEEEEELEKEENIGAPGPGVPLEVKGRWRYPLGRCVDAPVLLLNLDFDPNPDLDKVPSDGGGQQQKLQQQQAGIGTEPQQQGLPSLGGVSAGPNRLCAVMACSHDGDVACLDEATGAPYWHVQLPARAEAGMAISWGHNMRGRGGSGAGGDTDPNRAGASLAPDRIAGSPLAIRYSDASGPSSVSTSGLRGPQTPAPQDDVYKQVPYVMVACGDGLLYSLGLEDGAVWGAVNCGGEFKSPPVCDPWVGAVWATGHGRQLVVMRPPDEELARMHLGAPISVPVAFASIRQAPAQPPEAMQVVTVLHEVERQGAQAPPGRAGYMNTSTSSITSGSSGCSLQEQEHAVRGDAFHCAKPHDQQQHQSLQPPAPQRHEAAQLMRLALVTTLEGSTHGIRVDAVGDDGTPTTSPPASASHHLCVGSSGSRWGRNSIRPGLGASGSPPRQIRLSRLWSLRGPAPVFSALLVLPQGPAASSWTQSEEAAIAIVGHVDGFVRALHLEANRTHSPGTESGSPPPSVRWSTRLKGNLFADLAHLPGAGAVNRMGFVLAATHAGILYGLDAAHGTTVWVVNMACGPVSAAPAPIWVPASAILPASHRTSRKLSVNAHEGTILQVDNEACWIVAVCASSGALLLVRLSTHGGGDGGGGVRWNAGLLNNVDSGTAPCSTAAAAADVDCGTAASAFKSSGFRSIGRLGRKAQAGVKDIHSAGGLKEAGDVAASWPHVYSSRPMSGSTTEQVEVKLEDATTATVVAAVLSESRFPGEVFSSPVLLRPFNCHHLRTDRHDQPAVSSSPFTPHSPNLTPEATGNLCPAAATEMNPDTSSVPVYVDADHGQSVPPGATRLGAQAGDHGGDRVGGIDGIGTGVSTRSRRRSRNRRAVAFSLYAGCRDDCVYALEVKIVATPGSPGGGCV